MTRHEIGSVAKLTGLTIHNLRVWERRHGAIKPERSHDGRRLYSDKDIDRLTRLKRCIDNGDRIGSIANLDDETLRARAEKFDRSYSAVKGNAEKDGSFIRMGLAGMPLFRHTLENFSIENNYKVRFCFGVSTISDISNAYAEHPVDCIVTEVSNITDEIATKLIDTSTEINGIPIVVLHHFSRKEIRDKLEFINIWPINSLSSAATTLAMVIKKVPQRPESSSVIAKAQSTFPKPIFSTLQLSIIQQIDTSLPCECPKHISCIIRSLQAFEEYSANCEILNEHSSALHEEARIETANARYSMEQLLQKMLKADGIDLNDIVDMKINT